MSIASAARMASCNCFLYFAYGSNLLTERIHINNPSAKMVDIGKLKVSAESVLIILLCVDCCYCGFCFVLVWYYKP